MTMGEVIRDYEEKGIERIVSGGEILDAAEIFKVNYGIERFERICISLQKAFHIFFSKTKRMFQSLRKAISIVCIEYQYMLYLSNNNEAKKHWHFYKNARKQRVRKKHLKALKKILSKNNRLLRERFLK